MACGITIAPSLWGFGKFVAPWARMRRENVSARVRTCGCGVAEWLGSSDLQARSADAICELPTPNRRGLSSDLLNSPLLSGPGQSGTPWFCTHLANARARS